MRITQGPPAGALRAYGGAAPRPSSSVVSRSTHAEAKPVGSSVLPSARSVAVPTPATPAVVVALSPEALGALEMEQTTLAAGDRGAAEPKAAQVPAAAGAARGALAVRAGAAPEPTVGRSAVPTRLGSVLDIRIG